MQVEISVQNKRIVEAEPVPIRLEIRNRSKQPVEVISSLEPKYPILRFRVRDPDGATFIPKPSVVASIVRPERMTLGPRDKLTYTALLRFGVVDGVERFVFSKMGEYRVEAVYLRELAGKPILSRPIAVIVVEAKGVDRQAQRLFMGLEQGRLAARYGGTQAALDSFNQLLRDYPTSRFAPYAGYYVGMHYQAGGDYKRSVELFERILKDYKDFPLNADVMYQLAMAFWDTGKKEEVRRYLKQLTSKDPSHLAARRGKKLLGEL